MPTFEDVMALAVQLPLNEREHLGRALGLKLEAPKNLLPMATAPDLSRTDPQAWRERERGHAVLNTAMAPGTTGADAIRGMWAQSAVSSPSSAQETVSQLAPGTPVVVHTSVVLALAHDLEATRAFWQSPPVEVRLATPTYLSLLEACQSEGERERVQAFVAPFAVLSLGPMASNRAAQLMLAGGDLSALDALIAATAMAHEIPLLTREPEAFAGVFGLQIAVSS